MPDNDLGTAHGRIRIEYEGRGADKANAALIKMAAQFEQMNKRLAKIEKALGDTNEELEQTSTQMRRTGRSSRLLSGDILGTHRRFRSFRNEVGYLKDDLMALNRGIQATRTGYQRLAFATRIFNQAGQYNSRQQLAIFRSLTIAAAEMAEKTSESYQRTGNGLRFISRNLLRNESRLLGTRSAVTLLGTAYFNLRNKVLGVNNAIGAAPSWIQKMNRVSTAAAKMAGAFGILSVAIGPFRLLERLAKTGIFDTIVKGFSGMAFGVERFGRLSEKVFGRDITRGLVGRLRNAEGSMTRFLENSGTNFARLSDRIRNTATAMTNFAKDSKSLIGGLALVATGVGNLWQRFQWFFKLPKPLMAGLAVFISRILPTALYGLGKALVGTSNLFVGLVDGVKQLAGGLTVLPGLLGTIGAAVTSLIPVFAGLGDKLKDVLDSDPEKAMEAWYKLPDHLKPVFGAIKDLKKPIGDLQASLQKFAFAGAEKQIKDMGAVYLPLFEQSALRVVGALRTGKDRLVEFAAESKTQADFKNIYGSTAQAIYQMADALKPALRGLMDMAAVGADFLSTTAVWVPILTDKFRAWAQVNRQNGNMMRWMQDSRQGLVDLTKGLIDAGKATGTLLGLFSTNNGDNFLDRFADAMERFNAKVKESAATGFLARLRDGIQNLGEKRMEDLNRLWRIFADLIKGITPFVNQVADSFSNKFIPMLQFSMFAVREFIELLHALGLDHLIGWILGTVGAFKLLPKVLGTVIDSIKVFAGLFLVLVNKQKVINGITSAFTALAARMEKMGSAGAVVANGMMNVSGAVDKTATILGKLVSGFTIGGAAILVFFAAWESGNKRTEAFNKSIQESNTHLAEFGNSLRKAFLSDRTLVGKSVMADVSAGVDTMMRDLQNAADQAPGIMDHISDFFDLSDTFKIKPVNDWSGFLFSGETEDFNRAQNYAATMERVRSQLQALKDENFDLSKVIISSDSAYQKQIETWRSQGRVADETVAKLDEMRGKYQQVERDMRQLGPAGAEVKDGLNQISEAAADASQKLDGLRLVLQGLGYLKTNTLQATAEYTDAITTMADKVAEALTGVEDSSAAWDKQTNSLNLDSKAGRALLDVLVPISQKFQAMAANGGDANKMWQDMQGEIDATVTALNNAGVQINKEQFVNFLQNSLGTAPIPINIALQTGDNSEAALSMKALMLSLQGLADHGVFLPVNFETEDAAKKFDQELEKVLGHDVTDVNGTNIVLKAGVQLQPDDLEQLKQKLAQYGFKLPGTNVNAPVVPVAPAAPVEVPRSPDDATPEAQAAYAKLIEEAKKAAAGQEADVEAAGKKFVDAYAAGLENNPKAIEAAEKLAEEVKKRFHQSPPKKGPLAAHGDAAKYGGEQFVSSYAAGMSGAANQAGKAASSVAGAASGSLSGDRSYETGKFLGQISQLVDFASNAADAFGKMAETIFGFAKFISDPLGKGTFFGKTPKFIRDPNISDEALAKQRADAAQQRLFGVFGGGQRDISGWDATYGMPAITGPGKLPRGATGADVQAAIVAEGQRRGLTAQQIQAALATARHESGYNSGITGQGQGAFLPGGGKGNAYGVFQQTPEGGWGTVEQLTDPNYAINKFFDSYQENLKSGLDPLVAATLTQNPQLAGQVEGSDYFSKQQAAMVEAIKDFNNVLQSGAATPTVSGNAVPGIGSTPNLNPSILQDTGKVPSGPLSRQAAALIQQLWGSQLRGKIGGSRDNNTVKGTHDAGLSIDIPIGPDQMALGDEIRNWIMANADQLGVQYSIWRDLGINTSNGSQFNTPGHQNHIDVKFKDGATADIGPNGTKLNLPVGAGVPANAFKFPSELLGDKPSDPERRWTYDPATGQFTETTKHGENAGTPPGDLNPRTGQPYTDEEIKQLQKDYPMQYDISGLKPGDTDIPGLFQGTQEQLLDSLKANNPYLAKAITIAQDDKSSEADVIDALTLLEQESQKQKDADTVQSRAQADQLDSIISSAASDRGLTKEPNPIDQASQIAGAATSIAGDVFSVINSTIEAFGAAKNIGDTLVRGMENTEDVFRTIDDIQKFIQLGADIAGAVSSVASTIGGFVGAGGAGDPSGSTAAVSTAISAVSQIAGFVQAGLETANAIIDLGQEAYRIVGSYVGDFLGYLVGGASGGLAGDVKFLLDEQTNQLLAYSQDNPLDKRSHDLAFQQANPNARDQMIGNINVYGGPGRDPRDDTRQMVYQIKAAQMTTATGQ